MSATAPAHSCPTTAVGIRAGLQELRSITETIREMGFEPTMERRALELRPATEHEAERLRHRTG